MAGRDDDAVIVTGREFTSQLRRVDERITAMGDDIEQLHHILLEGNGRPAMTVQVATMETRLKGLEDQAKENRIPRHVWIATIISAIIGIIGIIVSLKGISSHGAP